MDDRIGTRLGPYRLLELLGEGGMGRVYLAEDSRLGRQVALKVLPPETASDPERLQRFEREARAIAALNHPGIVTIHSIEEVDGVRLLTMERVQGQTLTRLIPEGGLPLARFFPLATAIADAVAAAHEAGITHRDLKPDNVMIGADGRVKILDFGLAKLRQSDEGALDPSQGATASVTRDGRIVGTVAYMSPEQAQGLPIDHRSDVFSLGILLYEMITGRRPFVGDTNISVLSSILKDSPAPATDANPALPRPLNRMLARTLEKDPRQRYQSASDLRQDLEDLRRDVETGELLATQVSSPAFAAMRAAGGRWALPLVGVSAALVALGLWWGSAGDAASPPPPGSVAAPRDDRPSLAVFDFQNLSRDPELDWLSSGLSDMLVTDLSQSPELRVLDPARLLQILSASGAAASDEPLSFSVVEAVARETQVRTAVVGSYMRAGETLRISARLQDASTGEVLASESVEGPGEGELFRLVDDLSRRIRARLEIAQVGSGLDRDLRDVTTSSLQAYRAYVAGMRLHERLQEEQALPHLERALELDPGFAMAAAKLSVVHQNLGHYQKSRELAKRALDHQGRLSDRERYYIEGRYYSLEPATLEQGIAAYSKAVERFPDHSAARNNLAQQLMELDRFPEAIQHFEELRRRGMTFPATYEGLARARAAVGEPGKGLAVLEEFARRNADNATAQLYLANYRAGMGDYQVAERDLARALSVGADPAEVAQSRFVVAVLQGDLEGAGRSARKLAELRPGRGRVLRGILLAWRGRLDPALAELRAAAGDAEMGKSEFGLLLPELLLEAGRLEEAARALTLYLDAPSTQSVARAYALAIRALVNGRLGQAARARSDAERVRAELGALPAPLARKLGTSMRGLLALAEGRPEEARVLFEESLSRLHPDPVHWDVGLANTWAALAELARARGDAVSERAWLEQLASAGSGRVLTPLLWVRGQYRLGELLEAAGEGAAAVPYYRSFLHHWGDGELDREQVARARERLTALGAAD